MIIKEYGLRQLSSFTLLERPHHAINTRKTMSLIHATIYQERLVYNYPPSYIPLKPSASLTSPCLPGAFTNPEAPSTPERVPPQAQAPRAMVS